MFSTLQTIYATIIVMTLMVANMLTRGLILNIIAVRISRGKKVLVYVRGADEWHWCNGEIKDDWIRYKNRDGDKKSIFLSDEQNVMTRAFNLPVIMTDGLTNALLTPNLEGVKSYDAKEADNVITRALKKPSLEDERMKLLMLIAFGVVAILMVYLMFRYLPGMQTAIINGCQEAVKGIRTV